MQIKKYTYLSKFRKINRLKFLKFISSKWQKNFNYPTFGAEPVIKLYIK